MTANLQILTALYFVYTRVRCEHRCARIERPVAQGQAKICCAHRDQTAPLGVTYDNDHLHCVGGYHMPRPLIREEMGCKCRCQPCTLRSDRNTALYGYDVVEVINIGMTRLAVTRQVNKFVGSRLPSVWGSDAICEVVCLQRLCDLTVCWKPMRLVNRCVAMWVIVQARRNKHNRYYGNYCGTQRFT